MLGPTGVGRSLILLARADGGLRHLLARLSRIEVLVIDDWAMAPLNESERREIGEICEDRYQTRSTILTSQMPVSHWHEQIGDPAIADGILERLGLNAHRIEVRGITVRIRRWPTALRPSLPPSTAVQMKATLSPWKTLCVSHIRTALLLREGFRNKTGLQACCWRPSLELH